MCYHFALVKAKANDLVKSKIVSLKQISLLEDNFHISGFQHKTSPVLTDERKNEFSFLNWGLIPNWVSSPEKANEIKRYTLNAKSETIFQKPSFSESIKKRRCLILASGFYEWHTRRIGNKTVKYPYYISMHNNELFVFGGVWDVFVNKQTGERSGTFSIITTQANKLMSEIHNSKKRMPLIIPPEMAKFWLNPNINEKEISNFFVPFETKKLKAHTISRSINSSVKNNNHLGIQDEYSYPELMEVNKSLF